MLKYHIAKYSTTNYFIINYRLIIDLELFVYATWLLFLEHSFQIAKMVHALKYIDIRSSYTCDWCTVYPKKYAHGFCFAVLCYGYTLTDFPISTRLTSLALWQSNDCPSAGKTTLMNMDKYFMWNHYERLHNHNKAKHNKTVCIFIGIYCMGLFRCYHTWLPSNKSAVTCACNSIFDTICSWNVHYFFRKFCLLQVPAGFSESCSYLTGATAAELRGHFCSERYFSNHQYWRCPNLRAPSY